MNPCNQLDIHVIHPHFFIERPKNDRLKTFSFNSILYFGKNQVFSWDFIVILQEQQKRISFFFLKSNHVFLQHLRENKNPGCFCSRDSLEATPRFELGSQGFADPCLTTWLCRHTGADDEARTRYLHLGKVALYQMSYVRRWCLRSESNQWHGDFQSPALPTELQRHNWRPGTGSNRRPPAWQAGVLTNWTTGPSVVLAPATLI